MKLLKKIMFSAIIIALTVTTTVPTTCIMAKNSTQTTQTEIKFYDVTVKVKSFTSAKLSWKKKNVSEYRIYDYNASTGKKKLIKTVPGNSTGCTIKTTKKKIYNLYIDGITYNKKKAIVKYRGDASFVSGISPFEFEEYDYAEAKTSARSITLSFFTDNAGLTPDGYEVYRSDYEDELYEKIATVKKSNYKRNKLGYIQYTDKNVEFGETYYYKLRSYKIINGKKCYSKYSCPNKHTAINNEGLFDVKRIVEGDTITLAVTSDTGNGSFDLSIDNIFHTNQEDWDSDDTSEVCPLKEFKYNDIIWTSGIKNYSLTVNAGDTMYFTFVCPDKKNVDHINLYSIEYIHYNGFTSNFVMNIDAGTVKIIQDSEFIH